VGPPPTLTAAVPAEGLEAVRSILAADGVECAVGPVPTDGDLAEQLAGVEFLVLDHERRDLLPVLARLPALRVVQVLIVGTEWVRPFLPAGTLLGRPVGARDTAVAEWVASALLGIASGLLPAVRIQPDERWVREPSRELRGQRVVVVGQGTTGRATAELLTALGVEVVRVAAHARPGVLPSTALPELVEHADAVVLLVPDTPETTGMVDAALLARMRTGAVLVNAGRGPAVDTDAIVAELRTGRLRAVLDVTDPEPLPPGHPLWQLPACHVSPHVAGATHEARERSLRRAAEQLARYARGQELVAVERV
jgi:phosphoglycerate dehydrogenase-like enzyme